MHANTCKYISIHFKHSSTYNKSKPRTHDQQMLANMFANSVGKQKFVCVQKVDKHFMLANKRQTVRCDWLAVVNIMAAEWMDASCVDYTNYTSPFSPLHYPRVHPNISGAYVFAYAI